MPPSVSFHLYKLSEQRNIDRASPNGLYMLSEDSKDAKNAFSQTTLRVNKMVKLKL